VSRAAAIERYGVDEMRLDDAIDAWETAHLPENRR
jgi:hypothetical protein